MSDCVPERAGVSPDATDPLIVLVATIAAGELPDILRRYFARRREACIMELRELDRMLGLPQTIPERRR